MVTNYRYLKNSNTGILIKEQSFVSFVPRLNFPNNYYDVNGQPMGDSDNGIFPDLTGFVEISEKKFEREKRKFKNKNKETV